MSNGLSGWTTGCCTNDGLNSVAVVPFQLTAASDKVVVINVVGRQAVIHSQ